MLFRSKLRGQTDTPARNAMHRENERNLQTAADLPPTAITSREALRPSLARTAPSQQTAATKPTPPPPARLTPTKAQALRTTTLANTWAPSLATFQPDPLARNATHREHDRPRPNAANPADQPPLPSREPK